MEQPKVTVCANCLCAACWQGTFRCSKYITSETVEKRIEELQKLDREHPSYWET